MTRQTVKTKPVFLHMLKQISVRIFEHGVSKSAAALAYYLLFAMFPFLIFISNLLGLVNWDVGSIMSSLQAVLPKAVVELAVSYLNHVSGTSSETLLWFSLVFTVYFPMRAIRGLMDDVRTAYQLGRPKSPVLYSIRQLLFTLFFFVVIILTLFLSTLGKNVLGEILRLFPRISTWKIPGILWKLWHYLRFAIAYLIMLAALGLLYASAQDSRQGPHAILPGAFFSSVVWLLASMGFSFYVENFANYSIIYGTLGTVIVLLTWLYMTAFVLILGAEINAVITQNT